MVDQLSNHQRRAAYFRQLLGDTHVTHGEFTDLVNKQIKQPEFRLSDSKKVSDWIANGIPGYKTTIKARSRQLAIIKVLGIERNSDQHKRLIGRLPIPYGLLDGESKPQECPQTARTSERQNSLS